MTQNRSSDHVQYYKRPKVKCHMPGCQRNAVFDSGRCGACEDAAEKKDFAILDSYLKEMRS
jgi:hypothetical protein